MIVRKIQQKSVFEVRILEAAALLFSSKGFSGTGTRQIAQLAGVNETTLFRYYGTKKDLFWAALEARLARLKLGRELQSALASDESPRTVLPMLFEFLVQTVGGQPELMRLLYVSALELPGSDEFYRRHIGGIFDAVCSYLAKCAKRGAIRPVDEHMLTFALVGSVLAHVSSFQLFVGKALPFATAEQSIAAYSEFWLRMLDIAPSPITTQTQSSALSHAQ